MAVQLKNSLLILSGSLMLALGVALFLQPNQIASGGTPGMAILLCHLTGLTVGALMLLINIPLLIAGCFCLGQGFVWRSVVAVILISALVDFLNGVIGMVVVTRSLFLSAVVGGALIGFGVGLILRGDASAGGPTIVARLVAARSRFRPGQVVLLFDSAIVLSSALVFGALEPALWSLLSVVVTGRAVDLALRIPRWRLDVVWCALSGLKRA